MRQVAALVVSTLCVLASASMWAQTETSIVIEAGGTERGAFVPRSVPYTKEGPAVGVYLFDRQNVRASDGQVLTGFEFRGWTEGAGIRVQVSALVPKEGQPNAYMPQGDAENLQRRDFASYLVRPGESQSIKEMAALGIEPMVVRATLRDGRRK